MQNNIFTVYKLYIISHQATSLDDIVHWSKDFDSKPISDTVPYISELFLLWTEVQRELSGKSYSSITAEIDSLYFDNKPISDTLN